MSARAKSEDQIDTEAAAWFTTMHSGEADAATRTRFEAWLRADPAHTAAYHAFEQVYRDLDHVAVEAGIDLDAALDRGPRGWRRRAHGWLGGPALTGAAAVLGAVVIAAAVATLEFSPFAPTPAAEPEFTTKIAEIREIPLADGTRVTLGARSEIATEFSDAARTVRLLKGEAFFEVTKDPARPFFVAVDDTLIRVVGTKFDVKRAADFVHVSVLEGVVEVMKPDDLEETVQTANTAGIDKQVLTAGERVSAAPKAPLPPARIVDRTEPGGWREGRLAYENASLAEIVDDLNRYYDRPIRIATPDVGDLRSTIAFRTAEIDQVFDALVAIQPVEVDRTTAREIIIRRRR